MCFTDRSARGFFLRYAKSSGKPTLAALAALSVMSLFIAACGTEAAAPKQAGEPRDETRAAAQVFSASAFREQMNETETPPEAPGGELPACAKEYLRLNYSGYTAEIIRRDARGLEAKIAAPGSDCRTLFFDARCNLLSDKACK